MAYSLVKHLGYSVWATEQLSKILEKADEAILKKETASSFPTIEKTILHIWDAELIWMKRLQGESLSEWPSKTFSGNREALLKGWLENTIALRDHISAKDDAYLSNSFEYKNMAGLSFSNTAEEILYHVINHGTFHRGQIVTMLRANGFSEMSSTDLITYLRVVG